jgi:hypothetical protein
MIFVLIGYLYTNKYKKIPIKHTTIALCYHLRIVKKSVFCDKVSLKRSTTYQSAIFSILGIYSDKQSMFGATHDKQFICERKMKDSQYI